MKQLLTTSLIFVLLSLASHAYALPACTGDEPGTWDDCFGTYTLVDLSKYDGEYKDGKMHGQGTETWTNGSKYVGEFKNGKYNGKGTFTWTSGSKYVGEYKDNKRHGEGTFIHADGEKYIGEFKDNKRHGEGTYTWANGNKYVGEYKDNKRHGEGIHTWANGKVKSGIWADDEYLYDLAEHRRREENNARTECAKEAGKAGTEYAAKQIEKTCLVEKGLEPEPEPKSWYEW